MSTSSRSRAVSPSSPPQSAEKEEGEVRCYYFSPSVLRHERELLKKYGEENIFGLLLNVHDSAWGLAEIMKNINREVSIKSSVVFSLGCLFEHIADLVFRIQDTYGDVERVEEE